MNRRQNRSIPTPQSHYLGIAAGVVAAFFIVAAASAAPPLPELVYLKEHYTKYEYNIPMRDSVRLFTTVYAPKNNDKRYPILLPRTPYSLKPYGEDVPLNPRGPLNYYAKEGSSSRCRMCAGVTAPREPSSTCGRSWHTTRPKTSTSRRTPTTPSTGW